MRNRSPVSLLVLALTLTGCTSGGGSGRGISSGGGGGNSVAPPSSWAITASGIRVEVRRSPYGFTVHDATGVAVLDTAAGGAVAFATGQVAITAGVSPGYFKTVPGLDPWRGDWEVSQANATADTVTVTLASHTTATALVVTHAVSASSLRVEAKFADPAAAPPRAWSASFASPADERFLGFGERYDRTEQHGARVFSWSEESGIGAGEAGGPPSPTNPFPSGEAMTHYPVPFFVSTHGYGFWLDSTWWNEFDLNITPSDQWHVWHIGPTLAYEVYVPTPADARPWPYHLIDRFTARTGRPMAPPAWSLGPRRRINHGALVNGVLETEAMRQKGLAITAWDDTDHFLPGAGQRGNEPWITADLAAARALGYRVTGYYNPFFKTDPTSPISPEVALGTQKGYFMKNASGGLSHGWIFSGGNVLDVLSLDFTSPAAAAWYGSLFDWAIPLGYTGWMCDFAEYVQPNDVGASGQRGEELHNLYTVLYQRAIHDALEAGPLAGDWLTYVRSGYTGASHWSPMVWSGDASASFDDANGLPAQVRAGINLGVSGAPIWGSDIGGYTCLVDGAKAADGELITRWIEFGALSPDMHDEDSCVGASGAKATIWTSPDAQAAWREYARLHTRLFPYLDTLAKEAHASGAPLMRNLFLENPDRPDLAEVDDAYCLGPALLVAPVVRRGLRSRNVPLPAGFWLDWRDQAVFAGGGTVAVGADLQKIPIFLKDGALVPLLDPRIETLSDPVPASPSIIGPSAVADVYDVVGFLSRGKTGTFTLSGGGTLRAEWHGTFAAPTGLSQAATPADLATCTGCWWRDSLTSAFSRVRVSVPDGTVVTAGGLTLEAHTGRRVRWDIYIQD